jgi:3-oxoadipate enol-lactonase
MPSVSLNGLDIYFERSGSGPPLLYFNGSGATLERTGQFVDAYSSHFDVVAHDQRGLGRTGIPDGPYTMADYAADGAALAEHLGWERYRVVGTSFGGMVAQELAVTFPERIERLALLCTSPGGDGGSSYPLHTLAEGDNAALVEIIDTRFTREWLEAHDDDGMLASFMQARVPSVGEVRRGERLQLEARSHFDAWDRLPRITCPTLVAAGRYDGIAPPANGEAIAAQIPGAEIRLFEGGHMFFVQDATAMPEVIDFLRG